MLINLLDVDFLINYFGEDNIIFISQDEMYQDLCFSLFRAEPPDEPPGTCSCLFFKSQNIELLWKCIDDLTKEDSSFKENLSLNFVGNVDKQILDSLTPMTFPISRSC